MLFLRSIPSGANAIKADEYFYSCCFLASISQAFVIAFVTCIFDQKITGTYRHMHWIFTPRNDIRYTKSLQPELFSVSFRQVCLFALHTRTPIRIWWLSHYNTNLGDVSCFYLFYKFLHAGLNRYNQHHFGVLTIYLHFNRMTTALDPDYRHTIILYNR